MKRIIYAAVLFGLIACSTDNENYFDKRDSIVLKTNTASADEAANPENPYDAAGSNYLLLLDAYNALANKPVTDSAILDSLEILADNLTILSNDYENISVEQIVAIKQLANSNMTQALNTLSLSQDGQQYISALVAALTEQKTADADFGLLNAEMQLMEKEVLNSGLSTAEKQVVLVTFAIVRYEAYDKSRRKRRDRDWELSVGNIIATAHGATESVPNAIISGAVLQYLN